MFLAETYFCWDFGLGECPLSKHMGVLFLVGVYFCSDFFLVECLVIWGFHFCHEKLLVGILIWVSLFACGVFVSSKNFLVGFLFRRECKHMGFMFLDIASSCWDFDYGWMKSKQVNTNSYVPYFLLM